MTTALVLLAASLAVATLAMTGALVRSRLYPGPPLTGRTLVVHTRRPDDQTLRGVLYAQHADRLTLRDAVYVHRSGDQPIAGLAHVPMANIAFIQDIPPTPEGVSSEPHSPHPVRGD